MLHGHLPLQQVCSRLTPRGRSVVLVDVARDGQRDIVAGPRIIRLPVLISIELTVSTRSVA